MSKTFIKTSAIFVLIFLFGCKPENKNEVYFKNITWCYGKEIVFKDCKSVSPSEFDAKTQKFFNDSLFPLTINDSTISYVRYNKQTKYTENGQIVPIGTIRKHKTVKYDFKYINKNPKLILYLEPFPIILSTQNEIKLPETNNFNFIKFIVSNYSIGDQIDHAQLKTRGVYNYPNYTIEDCEYVKNKDLTFKIIGYNTIYSIERTNIEPYRLNDIIKVVSKKLNIEPEYSPMQKWSRDANYEYEFYRWEQCGVKINLSRRKYIGSDAFKTLINEETWTLTYDDTFLQAILTEKYRNEEPKSIIIH